MTCLWFNGQAEEAGNFYVKTFLEGGHSGKLGSISRYSKAGAAAAHQAEGAVMTVVFELDGVAFMGLNGGPLFKFSGATSFIIECKTQEEIDFFWSKLSEGGQEGQCGWINYDRFGITWQVVPALLGEVMSGGDGAKAERVMKAMLAMKKIDIAALKAAAGE